MKLVLEKRTLEKMVDYHSSGVVPLDFVTRKQDGF